MNMSAISNLPGNRNSTPEASNTLRPPNARTIGAGHALRASADMGAYTGAPISSRLRPSSEVYLGQLNGGQGPNNSDEMDKATQQWLADIDQYESTLEEMATATLDQDFKDELFAIEQWFRVLSEAERTSALYALIQQTTQVQQRFFIQVLTEMAKNHPISGILSPANFAQKDPMSQKLTDAMSKLTVEGSRNSVGLGRPPPSPGNKRNSGLDPSVISTMFPDAANAIAKEKEEFQKHTGLAPTSNRNSAVGLGNRNSLIAPTISAPEESRKEIGSQSSSSPWPQQPPIQRPKSSSGQPPMGQFTQPPPSAGLRNNPMQLGGDTNVRSTTLTAPDNSLSNITNLLSPYHGSGNWASMVNTPMVPNFSTPQQNATQAEMIANATAMKLAALSTVNNRIQFDDARKYRRARSSEGGDPSSPGLPPANFVMTNEHGQMLTPQQAAALQAQQIASLNGGAGRSRPSSPGVMVTGASGIPSVNFPLGAHHHQNNGFLTAYDTTTAAALAGLNLNQFSLGLGGPGSMSGGMGGGSHEGYISDHSEINRGRSPRGRRGSSKPPEDPTNPELLQDIPAWLRSLRLHKYTDVLKDLSWQELVEYDDEALEAKGVNALGARRKMLKVFEQIREAKQGGKL